MLLCNSRSRSKYGSFYICFIDHCSCTLHRFYIGFYFHSSWLTYIHHRFSWRETVGIRGLHGKWLVITSIRDRLCATHQWWFIHLWLRICFAVLIYYDYYWYSSYILFHFIYFSVYPISTTCFFICMLFIVSLSSSPNTLSIFSRSFDPRQIRLSDTGEILTKLTSAVVFTYSFDPSSPILDEVRFSFVMGF